MPLDQEPALRRVFLCLKFPGKPPLKRGFYYAQYWLRPGVTRVCGLERAMTSESFIKAMQGHPHIMAIIGVVAISLLTYGEANYEKKAPVEQMRTDLTTQVASLKNELSSIQVDLNRYRLETKISSLESQIFDIERVVETGKPRDIDYSTLSKLKSELNQAERELARLP